MSAKTLGEQLARAAQTGAIPKPAAAPAPVIEDDEGDFNGLFEMASVADIMPQGNLEVTKQEVKKNEVLLGVVEASVTQYTRALWPVRVEGETLQITQKGYFPLYEAVFGEKGLLNGHVVNKKGETIALNDSLQQAVMERARLAYAKTAIPLIVDLRPGNREVFGELLNDLEQFQIVREATAAEKKSATWFGDRALVADERVKEYADVMALLVIGWNSGVRAVEKDGFKKDVKDLRTEFYAENGKGLTVAEVKNGTTGKKFLFAPAWNGMAGGKKVTDPRPATALTIEVVAEEGHMPVVKVLEVVSTNATFENHIKAIVDGGIFVPVAALKEGRLTFKSRVTRDFFDKASDLLHLVKAGLYNEERNEGNEVEVDRLKEGTMDMVSWYREAPAGSTAISFRPWKEDDGKGAGTKVFVTVKMTRSEAGRNSAIRFDGFAPAIAVKQLPLLKDLVGKDFVPTGGPKFEGNVTGGVSTDTAKLFRRMLSAGYAIASAMANKQKKQNASSEAGTKPDTNTESGE